jgi:hypothetical protein
MVAMSMYLHTTKVYLRKYSAPSLFSPLLSLCHVHRVLSCSWHGMCTHLPTPILGDSVVAPIVTCIDHLLVTCEQASTCNVVIYVLVLEEKRQLPRGGVQETYAYLSRVVL